jgi:hypothetical protein
MTLNRNVTDYHTEIEQAAFEPNNLVPGITLSPDKMLLARGFSYADAHRARLGVNYKQIPVNSPKVPVHSYSKDGAMRIHNVSDPVYAPNSKGGPQADSEHFKPVGWYADGDMVRAAYTPHEQDDDWGQAGTMVREVLDDAARERLVSNVVGHLLNGVTEPVLVRAFDTGTTWTRTSATGSGKTCAPSRVRRTPRRLSRRTPPAAACRPRRSASLPGPVRPQGGPGLRCAGPDELGVESLVPIWPPDAPGAVHRLGQVLARPPARLRHALEPLTHQSGSCRAARAVMVAPASWRERVIPVAVMRPEHICHRVTNMATLTGGGADKGKKRRERPSAPFLYHPGRAAGSRTWPFG